jgi:hypothetical protein
VELCTVEGEQAVDLDRMWSAQTVHRRGELATSRRQDDRFHLVAFEQVIKRSGEFCTPVVEQIALAQRQSIDGVG